MDLLTWAGLAAVIVKLTSCTKFIENKEWKLLKTQLYAFGLGILAVFLASEVQGIQSTVISGFTLEDLNFWSKVFVGLNIGAGGSVIVDSISAVDNHRTTKI